MTESQTSQTKSRRPLDWTAVKGPRAISCLAIATSLGAGLFPFAPGTMGTLFSVPLTYWTNPWAWPLRAVLWIFLFVIGTWSAKVFDELMHSKDNQNIVIDEVVGYGITAWTAGREWKTLLAAFVLFRFFDVIKPTPIRQVDEWSKIKAGENRGESSRWWGGFGVMADDVLAGIQGLIVILILQHFQFLP